MSGQFLYFYRNLEKEIMKFAKDIYRLNRGYLVFNNVQKFI